MTSISPPRRSLSDSYKHNYLATLGEDTEEPACSLPRPIEPVDDHHPLVLAADHADEPMLTLEHRSKSESFICTAQGIVFEDNKSDYSSKLTNLMALAANANALGTQSNVLLAKKALRYRKAIGRRRKME
ncbi:hypothetical protein JG687_00008149 [Phytophthora cactorum]|nr:hypothetical protein Pcac1_g9522 [Phytophthora cactorum]KAG6964229.1 hypothetical protein JG688_00007794 [Phytophthora aleatoria]KAG2831939.1 hypothetical protein PC112_g7106 [Phytophthora cactorum]KAG2839658.1 hypothetical protein PC111_g3779 [Phytophthora cactorum]KAG2864127.1 hypothetical protein PC113_g4848 [Phytophthora cactorum]